MEAVLNDDPAHVQVRLSITAVNVNIFKLELESRVHKPFKSHHSGTIPLVSGETHFIARGVTGHSNARLAAAQGVALSNFSFMHILQQEQPLT